MRRRPLRSPAILLLTLCIFASLSAVCQEGELQPKARKLYEALLGKPFSESLSEHFRSACLEDSSFESLEKFLSSKVEDGGAAAPANAAILALACEAEGRDDKALLWHEKALELKPGWPEAMLARASLLTRLGRFKDASEALEKTLKLEMPDETRQKAVKALGRAYAKAGDSAKAVEIWERLSKERPDDFDLAEEALELEIEEGLLDEAAEACGRLVKSAPTEFKRTALELRLGDICAMQGEREKSVATYSSALDKAGAGSWLEREILSQIEKAFRAEDDLPGLISACDSILEKNPGRVEVARRRATLLLERGDSQKAIDALTELVKATPGDKAGKELLASALEKAGKPEEALSILSGLCSQFPNDAELPLKKAAIESALKKTEDCATDMREHVRRSKNSEYAFMRAAKLLASYGMNKEAESMYEELVAAFPESVEAAEARAVFLYSLGKTQQALEALTGLASKGDLDTLLRISKDLRSLREGEKALEALKAKESVFGSEGKYLEELTSLYSSLGRKDEACDAALKAFKASSGSPQEAQRAISAAAQALKEAGKLDFFLASLAEKPSLSEQETCLLAELQLQKSEPGKALAALDAALAASPGSPSLLDARLQACRKAGRADETAATLKRIMDSQPAKASWCLRELAETSLRAGLHAEALSWTERLKKSSPGVAAPFLLESRILQDSGDWKKAAEVLSKAWRKFPEDREIPRSLALCAAANGDYAAASSVWWRILDSEQELSGQLAAVGELARLAAASGDIDSLIRRLRTRMEANPKSVFPPLALAETYRLNGNYEERRNLLLKASALKGDDPSLLHEVARMEEEEGDYEKALSTLRRAAVSDKTDKSKRLLAQLLFRTGDADAGFQALWELAGGTSMPPEDAADTAMSLIASGNASKAAEFLAPFLKLHPGEPSLAFAAAVAAEETGDRKDAMARWLSLVDLPDFPQKQSKAPASTQQALASSRLAGALSTFGKLPDEAIKALEIQAAASSAYLYRSSFRQGRSYMGYSQPASSFIPQDAESIRNCALAHLGTLSSSMGKEERDGLIQALSSKGVAYAGLKLPSQGRRSPYGLPDLDTLSIMRKAAPEDETIAALWALSIAWSSASKAAKPKQDEIEDALRQFKDKNPDLAFSIFCSAMTSSKSGAPPLSQSSFDESLALIDKAASPSPYQISLLTAALSSRKLPPQMKSALRDKLFEWSVKAPPQGAFQSVFIPLARELVSSGEPSKFASLLQKAIDDGAKAAPANQPAVRYALASNARFMASNARLMASSGIFFRGMMSPMGPNAEFQFPPPQLAGVPQEVLAFFRLLIRQAEDSGEKDAFEATGEEMKAKQDAFWSACASLKPPAAKLLLAEACGKDAEAAEIAKGLLSSPDKSFASCMLFASWAAFKKDMKAAAGALAEALSLTSDKNELKEACGLILLLAANAGDATEFAGMAKAAAEKLMALGLTREEKGALAQRLESIGMEKEAEAIDRSLMQAAAGALSRAGTVSRRTMPVRSARPAGQPIDAVRAAFKRGDAAEGVRLAAKEFRRTLKANASYSMAGGASIGLSFNENVFHQLKSVVESASATDAFLKELEPKDGAASNANALECAFALEVFGRRDEAAKAYAELLAKDPSNKGANFRMALLLAGSDPDKALAHFSKLGPMDHLFMQIFLTQLFSGGDIDRRLNAIPLVAKIVEAVPPGDSGMALVYSILNFLQLLEQPSYGRNPSLPGIFSKPDPKKTNMELFKRRRDLYLSLCESCIKNPQLAGLGFQSKLALLEAEGSPLDESLYRQALDVLKTSSPDERISVSQRFSRQTRSVPRGAEDFAVEYAAANGKLAGLRELAAALPEPKRQSLLKKTGIYSSLLECPQESFLKTAESLALPEPQTEDGEADLSDFAFLSALDAMRQRKIEVSLTPLALKLLAASTERPGLPPRQASILWAKRLAEDGDFKGLSAYFKESLDMLFPEPQEKDSKTSATGLSRPDRALYQKTSAFSMMAAAAVAVDLKAVFLVLDAIQASKGAASLELQRRSEMSQCVYELSNRIDSLEPLKGSALLGGFDSFNPYPFHYGGNGQSALVLIVQKFRGGDLKDKILKELEGLSPQTFGSKLIASLVMAKSREDFLNLLERELPQIKAASPERRRDVLPAIDGTLSRMGIDLRTPDPGHAELQKLFSEAQGEVAVSNFDEFMSSTIVNGDVWGYANKAADIVSALAASHPDKAEAALNHAIKRVKAFHIRNSSSFPSQPDYALTTLFERLSSGMKSPRALEMLLKTQDIPPAAANSVFRRFEELFSRSLESKLSGMSSRDSAARLAALKEAISAFAESLSAIKNPPPLAKPLANFAQSLSPQELDELAKETGSRAASSQFLKEAAAVFERLSSIKTKSPPPASFVSYAKALMDDEAIPACVRLRFFSDNLKLFSGAPELESVVESAAKGLLKLYPASPRDAAEATAGILEALSSSNLPSDKLKLLASPIINAWLDSINFPGPGRAHPDFETARKALSICLAIGDDSGVARLLADPDAKLGARAPVYAMLLNAGKTSLCAETLRKNWQDIASSRDFGMRLSSDGEKAAKELVESLDDPDLKLLAEALLLSKREGSSAPDAGGTEDSLPARFLKTDFKNKELRLKTLSLILSGDQAQKATLELLPQLCADIATRQIVCGEDDNLRDAWLKRLRLSLERGDFACYATKCQEFAAAAPDRRDDSDGSPYYNSRNFIRRLANELMDSLSSTPSKDSASPKIPPGDLLRTLSLLADKWNIENSSGGMERLYACAFLLHFLAGEEGGLAEWIKRVQPKEEIQPPQGDCKYLLQALSKCAERNAVMAALEKACVRLREAYPKADPKQLERFKSGLSLAALDSADSFDGLKSLAATLPPNAPISREMEDALHKIVKNHFISIVKDAKSLDRLNPEAPAATLSVLKELAALPPCFKNSTPAAISRLIGLHRFTKNTSESFLLLKQNPDNLPFPFQDCAENIFRARLIGYNLIKDAKERAYINSDDCLRRLNESEGGQEQALAKLSAYLSKLADDESASPEYKIKVFSEVAHLHHPECVRHAPQYTKFLLASSSNSWSFQLLVTALDRCAESEEWRLAAGALCKKWRESPQELERIGRSSIGKVLDIQLRMNDMEGANAVMNNPRLHVFYELHAYLALLKANKGELAAGAFRKNWGKLNPSSGPRLTPQLYEGALIERSVEASKALPSDLSLLFRATIAVWATENNPSGRSDEESAQVLEPLIEEFKKTDFSDAAAKGKFIKTLNFSSAFRAGKLKNAADLKKRGPARAESE